MNSQGSRKKIFLFFSSVCLIPTYLSLHSPQPLLPPPLQPAWFWFLKTSRGLETGAATRVLIVDVHVIAIALWKHLSLHQLNVRGVLCSYYTTTRVWNFRISALGSLPCHHLLPVLPFPRDTLLNGFALVYLIKVDGERLHAVDDDDQ